jgi:hypothetical protein
VPKLPDIKLVSFRIGIRAGLPARLSYCSVLAGESSGANNNHRVTTNQGR